jgi:hypothetical protein
MTIRYRGRTVNRNFARSLAHPAVQVVPVGHTSTPAANSGLVHAVPAATVPFTYSVDAPSQPTCTAQLASHSDTTVFVIVDPSVSITSVVTGTGSCSAYARSIPVFVWQVCS